MFAAAGVEPSPAAATNAFVALSTDTGDFRYSNATARAFRAAAEMVERGAEPDVVATWVHESKSRASVRLLGEALRTLELACDGRLALVHVDQGAFDRAGAEPSDTENIINSPRTIAGVQVVALFKQWEAGRVGSAFARRAPSTCRQWPPRSAEAVIPTPRVAPSTEIWRPPCARSERASWRLWRKTP